MGVRVCGLEWVGGWVRICGGKIVHIRRTCVDDESASRGRPHRFGSSGMAMQADD